MLSTRLAHLSGCFIVSLAVYVYQILYSQRMDLTVEVIRPSGMMSLKQQGVFRLGSLLVSWA